MQTKGLNLGPACKTKGKSSRLRRLGFSVGGLRHRALRAYVIVECKLPKNYWGPPRPPGQPPSPKNPSPFFLHLGFPFESVAAAAGATRR